MKPPMIPHQGRGIDTVNFRNVKESESIDISGSRPIPGGLVLPKSLGVPLDSGLATPVPELVDPFLEFNSVTLHHDGDEHHTHQTEDLHNGRYDGNNRE